MFQCCGWLASVLPFSASTNTFLAKLITSFSAPNKQFNIHMITSRFSGITESDLTGVVTTLQDVQHKLLTIFNEDTILVGHSLESDLVALKLIHGRVVNTSIVFPHRRGVPYKRALRNLVLDH